MHDLSPIEESIVVALGRMGPMTVEQVCGACGHGQARPGKAALTALTGRGLVSKEPAPSRAHDREPGVIYALTMAGQESLLTCTQPKVEDAEPEEEPEGDALVSPNGDTEPQPEQLAVPMDPSAPFVEVEDAPEDAPET